MSVQLIPRYQPGGFLNYIKTLAGIGEAANGASKAARVLKVQRIPKAYAKQVIGSMTKNVPVIETRQFTPVFDWSKLPRGKFSINNSNISKGFDTISDYKKRYTGSDMESWLKSALERRNSDHSMVFNEVNNDLDNLELIRRQVGYDLDAIKEQGAGAFSPEYIDELHYMDSQLGNMIKDLQTRRSYLQTNFDDLVPDNNAWSWDNYTQGYKPIYKHNRQGLGVDWYYYDPAIYGY